jgi:hypothetical protein
VALTVPSPDDPPYARNGDDVTKAEYVDKAQVVANLRSRDLHSRADWVDRQLPALIDTFENASLLRTLGIDVSSVSTPAPAEERPVAASAS